MLCVCVREGGREGVMIQSPGKENSTVSQYPVYIVLDTNYGIVLSRFMDYKDGL